jgi:predicted nucleotidyltransferase
MRITRDLLLSLARDNAAKFAAKDRSLVCVYLVGSLLREGAFLGGVTDIDLVCVHDKDIEPSREILRVNADVHFDITHLPQSHFEDTRKLRLDPWIGGSFDESPLALRDPTHWFDFTRASVTGAFWKPNFLFDRVNSFAIRARQTWQQISDETIPQGLKRTESYLEALSDTVNAIACFSGPPLTTRRLVLELPSRAEEMNLPELTSSFISLYTNDAFTEENWALWIPQWLNSFDALKTIKEAPLDVVPTRRNYYEKAADVFSEDHPAAALWVVLRTWTTMAAVLPKSEEPYKNWQAFIKTLGLDSRGLRDRIQPLDELLESVEGAIEAWRTENG